MTDQERYYAARRDDGLVVIEGFHALKHALRFGAAMIEIVTDDTAALVRLATALAPDIIPRIENDNVREVTPSALASLSPNPHPTGIIALAHRPAIQPNELLCDVSGPANDTTAAGGAHIVILDDPRHAGNIGASIRVAAAAGAAALFVTGAADPWHPAAVRGGAGLQFALPVARIASVPETARPLIAVDPDGDELGSDPLPRGGIVMFGSERDGISAALLARSTMRVRIPMRAGVSSLNLATAVAVMLYHGDQ